jgi:hypothetical protein
MPTWYNTAEEAFDNLGGNCTHFAMKDGKFAAVKDVSGLDRTLHTPHHADAVISQGMDIFTRPKPSRARR